MQHITVSKPYQFDGLCFRAFYDRWFDRQHSLDTNWNWTPMTQES